MSSMTLQLLIDNHIRTKLDDDEDERWSDDFLISMIREVVDLLDTLVNRYGLQFAKKRAALTTVIDQAYIDVSALDPPIGSIIRITRDANQWHLIHQDEDYWESMIDTGGELNNFMWYEDDILLKGTPKNEETLTMWYWPDLDTVAYDVDALTPWGGRMDFIIAQHVVMKAQNVDEMDIGMDDRFTKSLEFAIVRKFAGLFPRKRVGRGWLN
jgi:hypothetical protein